MYIAFKSRLVRFFCDFALLWDIFSFYGGRFFEPFFMLLFFVLGRMIYYFSKDLFYIFFAFYHFVIFVSTLVALKVLPIEKFTRIALPKAWGLLIALAFINGTVFSAILLTFFYALLYEVVWKFFLTNNLIKSYLQNFLEINFFWEQFLQIFTVPLFTGLIVNLIYHFLKLITLAF